MSIRYFTPRPPIVQAIEWTGDNFTEVAEFGNVWGFNPTSNGDGTLTVTGSCCTGTDLPAGTWLVPWCAMAQTAEALTAAYQEIPPPDGPAQYTL